MSGNGWWPNSNVITIPAGATTGARIVIDGINGTITMYDANNNITGQWGTASQSICMFHGNSKACLTAAGSQFGNTPGILLNPDTTQFDDGVITAPTNATPAVYIYSPGFKTGGAVSVFILQTESALNANDGVALISTDTQDGPIQSSGTWTALSYNSGFQYGGTGFVAGYRYKNGTSIELRGTFARTSGGLVSDDVPITLPTLTPRIIPTASVYRSIGTGNGTNGFATCRLQVGSNGACTVAWAGTSSGTFSPSFGSLDGIEYDTV